MFNTEVLGWKLSCKQNQSCFCKSTEKGDMFCPVTHLHVTTAALSEGCKQLQRSEAEFSPWRHRIRLLHANQVLEQMWRVMASCVEQRHSWTTSNDWKLALFSVLGQSQICISSGKNQSLTLKNKLTLVNWEGKGGQLRKSIQSYSNNL